MSIGVIPQFSPRYNYCWWPGVTSDQQPSGIWARRPGASEETRVWVSCNFPWPLLSWPRLSRDHCTSLISLSRYLSRVTRGLGEAGSDHRDTIITIVTSPSVSCPASLACLWAWELSSPTISYSRWLVTSEMNTSFHFLGPFNWESGISISIIYNLGVFVCHSQSWNLLKAKTFDIHF